MGDPLLPPTEEYRFVAPVTRPLGVRERVVVDRVRSWPWVADDTAALRVALAPGTVATVRTRWGGIRQLRVRIIGRSTTGRRFLVGHTDHGLCHRAWLSEVISTTTRPHR